MKSTGRQFKDAIYEQFSRIGKAVSSPKRLELLDLICQGEKTVETLSKETGLTIANTSQHLQTLKAARLIKAEKEGLYVKYRLAVEVLRGKGFNAIRLEESVQDWRAMGLPVEIGEPIQR